MTQQIAKGFASGLNIELGRQAGDEFDIQWMPPGDQDVECFVNGESRQLRFESNEQFAQAANSQLQELRRRAAAGLGDEPFFDFNHEDGAASGHPQELYWAGDDAKRGGIRAIGKWTGGGKRALAGRDFTRFSPEWFFNQETEEPIGVGVNMGGLVNRAAFKQLAALACDAHGHGRATQRGQKGKQDMDEKTFKELLDAALKPVNEKITALEAKAAGAAATAPAGAATAQGAGALDEKKIVLLIQEGNKPLIEKITAFEAAGAAAKGKAAKDAVQVHVNRGAIAPEDKEMIEFYTNGFLADPDKAEKAMAKLPGKSFTRLTTATGSTAAAGAASGEPEHMFIAKAKEFGKTHEIKNQAEAMMAYGRTAEGRELYEQFRSKIVVKK